MIIVHVHVDIHMFMYVHVHVHVCKKEEGKSIPDKLIHVHVDMQHTYQNTELKLYQYRLNTHAHINTYMYLIDKTIIAWKGWHTS